MASRDIGQVVELDIDRCSLTFGVGACPAALGSSVPRKCYNTYATCPVRDAYVKSSITLRLVMPSYTARSGGTYFPCVKSIGGRDQTVNIAGFNPEIGGLGQRASIRIRVSDFPYRDVLTDKYWQERMSGAAQIDEPGYDPLERGSFWAKLKARSPNYAQRPLRVKDGYHNGDAFVTTRTRNYVISEVIGPDTSGDYEIVAKDVLALAEDKKAQAPVVSRGRLVEDIDENATEFTIAPRLGVEYPLSGGIVIGSEVMGYSRVNNVFTVSRARLGTPAQSHSIDDTVQLAYVVRNVRADAVIYDLLTEYANVPPAWINYSEWQAEFDRWGSTLILNATICQPTGVTELLGEINQLGITLWWDEVAQRIRLRLNRPSEDSIANISDRNNVIEMQRTDKDDERVTRISFRSVQIDPTKGLANDNFKRNAIIIGLDEENANFFNQSLTREIKTRWLNQGNDAATKIISGRLFNRYKRAPVTFDMVLDAKDDLKLGDVITVDSYAAQDDTGKPAPTLCQVFYCGEEQAGNRVRVKAQRFQFDNEYGNITENSRPVYSLSTESQKNQGTYLVGPSLFFGDGRPAYKFV